MQHVLGMTQEIGFFDRIAGRVEEAILAQVDVGDQEPPILKDFTKFRNSFRIIAKQNSLQKSGKLLVIDAAIEVQYTIVPPPEYQAAADEYYRKHGKRPPSYQNMIHTCEMMSKKIHDHMVKMPLFRNYFAMLSVINFLSGFFSTLKKHRKIPVLPPLETLSAPGGISLGCPSLFPYLPISAPVKGEMKCNPRSVLQAALTKHKQTFVMSLEGLYHNQSQKMRYECDNKADLVQIIKGELLQNIVELANPTVRRLIREKIGETDLLDKQASALLEEIFQTFKIGIVDKMNTVIDGHYVSFRPDIVVRFVEKIAEYVRDEASVIGEIKGNSTRIFPEMTLEERGQVEKKEASATRQKIAQLAEQNRPVWRKYLDISGSGVIAYLSEITKVNLWPLPGDIDLQNVLDKLEQSAIGVRPLDGG